MFNGNVNTNLFTISDCLQHDSTAVRVFFRPFFTQNISQMDQQPNIKTEKNYSKLMNQKNDFGEMAAWHSFATFQSRNVCDRLGVTCNKSQFTIPVSIPVYDTKATFSMGKERN